MLVRLPVKSLCRFRCVSRAWRALISNPAFIAAQRSRAGPHLVGVFFGSCRTASPPEVRVMDMDGNVVKVLELRELDKDDDRNDILGVLEQQATTQLNVIVCKGRSINATAMIIDPAAGRACTFDTNTLETLSSFGRATPSGAHKVLFLVPGKICIVATIMNGSAEPQRWRERSMAPFITSCGNPRRKATVNGVIYFLAPHPNESNAACLSEHCIAAFDLETEGWKVINGPALAMKEETWYIILTEHKGTLGFVQFLRERNDCEHCYAIVWLLIDSGNCVWVKDCTIQMPRTWGLTKLLGALDDGRILLLVNEMENKLDNARYQPPQVLVSYNPDTKLFEKLMDIAMGFGDTLVLYTGSLLSCS